MPETKKHPIAPETVEIEDGNTESFEALAKEVADLRTTLANQSENDQVQQKAFDQLYEELRQYKEDFVFQTEKSLLLDLLLFYDSVNWFQQSLIKKEMSPDVIADSFQYLTDELLELLYRRDVLPMESNDTFDRQNHKVIKTVPAAAEHEDYQVDQVLKRGFTRSGRLLRAEEVVVKRFDRSGGGPPSASDPSDPSDASDE